MKGPAFYRATIGKKVVMAVTGVILVGWIIGHVLGNLLVFRGPAALNEYAALLKSNAALLWAMRAGLLVTVVLHVVAAVQLVRQEAASRPARYTKKVPQESTFASRTIRWGGLIIAVFVVYHLLHFTTGDLHPAFSHTDVYGNMTTAFAVPWVAAIYIVAVAALGLHLYHGVWSVFQTLGISHPGMGSARRRLAIGIAAIVYLGFTAIPVAFLLGLLGSR
jgi:succinate dehydrogenase / fumarate reductase, cytochrome b subunit